jgi:tRNA nucleotidyltransferase/poly(A) polymerase
MNDKRYREFFAIFSGKTTRKLLSVENLSIRELKIMAYYENKEAVVDWLLIRGKSLEAKTINDFQFPVFPLRGRDVLTFEISQGREIGKILSKLENQWVEEGFSGNRNELLERLKEECEQIQSNKLL